MINFLKNQFLIEEQKNDLKPDLNHKIGITL